MADSLAGVQKFLSNYKGGARPNRYRVQLGGGFLAGAGAVPKEMEFLCRSTAIPECSIGFAPVAYMGREIKVSGDKTFADWTVTVYNDLDWNTRSFFEKWVNGMLYHEGNITASMVHSTYFGNGKVIQLNRHDDPVPGATYKFEGIFPTTLGEIALAYDSNNTVEEFTVTFAVNWWENQNTPNLG
jgi:hypothetical protein